MAPVESVVSSLELHPIRKNPRETRNNSIVRVCTPSGLPFNLKWHFEAIFQEQHEWLLRTVDTTTIQGSLFGDLFYGIGNQMNEGSFSTFNELEI